ncbi:MAG: response regulator [Desulfobacteraceae bacterium]|nr:MAG: response regulator [Desulfobacteraceae bacterium]
MTGVIKMKTVLIAEDDTIFLKLLASSLRENHPQFDILTAENGKQAVTILNQHRISLLITDVKMPEMDGLALLAYVNENFPFIPCFVMTAYETPELRQKLPKDIRKFLRKPFPADRLGQEIQKILQQEAPKGMLSGISVSSFMMMIEMEKKTCILEVNLPDGEKGLFYFEKGILCNAVSSGLKGEEAALKFITRKKARFSFRPLPQKKIAKLPEMTLKDLVQKASALDMPLEKMEEKADTAPELNLSGVFVSSDRKYGGKMVVKHLSISDIRMKFDLKPEIMIDSKLSIEFNLDDQPRSHISKEVIVTGIDRFFVDAEFCSKEHYDRLGPYLHFNGLDEKNW